MPGPRDPLPGRTQVLVVGGGPVGLTAVNLLERLGVGCVLVEKNEQTSQLPKAIGVDDEYTRLLAGLGLADAVRAHASAPFGIHFTAASGAPLVRVQPFNTPNGFGNRIAVNQPLFEKTLLQAVPRRHAAVCYGAEFVALTQTPDEVQVQVRCHAAVHTIAASYVLACDGAKSPVRTALGIGFPGRRIDEPHLVVDLADFPDDTPASRFFCNPRRPMNSIPGPLGGRRLEFMLSPGDDHQQLLTDEGIRWLVDHFSPYRGVPLKIIRRAIYGFSERIADHLQDGRVFLLGDAGHVMPPFGGQGLNTGARDAANLAWKLAAVLQRGADPAVLDTYDAERRPQVSNIVRYSVRVGRLANIRSRSLAALRNMVVRAINLYPPARNYLAQMRYMPRPRIEAGLRVPAAGAAAPWVGTVFPRLTVEREGRPALIDELAGFRHAVVIIDPPPGWRPAAEWADNLDGIVLPLRPGREAPGVAGCADPLLERLLPDLRGHAVLVRPDCYIAGAVPASQAAELLRAYRAIGSRKEPA
jgi:3-(3-hydroxy-phenyl)propionate hydroxylase